MNTQVSVTGQVGDCCLDVSIDSDAPHWLVIGPNGAGKSTLLKMIVGGIEPQSGRIESAGTVLFDDTDGVNRPPERRHIGYLPQDARLFDHMTVMDNILYASGKSLASEERASSLMVTFGVSSLGARWPVSLSGGERQRVALVRALMAQPSLLLLDEPLSSVDLEAKKDLRVLLKSTLISESIPSIIITHDRLLVTEMSGHLVVMVEGLIVAQGAWRDVLEQASHPFIRAFFDA